MGYKYDFSADRCWFNMVCGKFKGKGCYRGCVRFMELDYLFYQSNIPSKLQYPISLIPDKADKEEFVKLREIKKDIINWVAAGKSLMIYSAECGNGKTCWAIKLMQKYFSMVWCGNGFKCRGVFINVTDFIAQAKDNISNCDYDFIVLKENIKLADLVIWDDIGTTALSKYDYDLLMGLINNRILHGKANIYTSNSTEEKLTECLGHRLKSRIYNESELVCFIGGDRRGLKNG